MAHQEYIHILKERGFLHQHTDIEAFIEDAPQVAYLGVDPTAKSIHVGNMVPLMMMRWWQKLGLKTLLVLGSGTTLVGDPSGRDQERPLLSHADILNNAKNMQSLMGRIVDLKGENAAQWLDNYEWLKDINYIEFLRDYGRHFSVNRMMSFESVRLRLEREQFLSFLEFNYMLLQAYDYEYLYKHFGCRLQIGGADQWGNIISGVDLIRRIHQTSAHVITCPLLTTADGAKMGKTAKGALWLDENLVSPYDFWQFWRNVDDRDVGRFLRIFTELPISEIEKLEALKDQEINEAKKILADQVTQLVHGEAAVQKARETAQSLFEASAATDLGNLPTLQLPIADLQKGISLMDLLLQTPLFESKGEIKRLIKGKGLRINDHVIEADITPVPADFFPDNIMMIRAGKKRYGRVQLVF